MKYSVLLFLFWVMFACNKETHALNVLKTDGCIEQITIPVYQHSIADSDVQTVNALFANSQINNSHFRYYGYSHDSVQTYYPPYAKFDSKVVRINQYANGLRIFNAEMLFQWYNDTLNYRAGKSINDAHLDTKANLLPAQLKQWFSDDSQRFDRSGNVYADSCLKAEFGYYDMNGGTGDSSATTLVKAWRVTLLHSIYPSEYPEAYYKDDGSLIYYTDGIETFR